MELCEDALGACLEESDQILGMLNTLMDISEAETGTVKLNKQVVKASTIIERIIDLYRYIAEERNIIEYNVHDDLYINVDPKIEQAFSNLIDNAIKYSPDGGRIDLEAFKGNKEVIFRVRDGGIGIPEEEDIALIISDQKMSGITGIELMEELARRYPDTIRILITGYAEENLFMNAIKTI